MTGRRFIRALVGPAVVLAVGEALGRAGPVSRSTLPPSTAVMLRLARMLADRAFLNHVGGTVVVWVAGLGAAVAVAVPAGAALGAFRALDRATRTLVELLRPVPSVTLIPLAVLLLGQGPLMRTSLAAYAATWPMLVHTASAVSAVDQTTRDTARACGLGRVAILLRVQLPAALPAMGTGVRVSAAVALVVTVGTELLAGGASGIGGFIAQATSGGGHADVVLAATLVAGILGFTANGLLEAAERRMLRWHIAPEQA